MTAFTHLVLKPAIPACLLAALAYAPPQLLVQITELPIVSAMGLDKVKFVLRLFVGLGFVRGINAALSALAKNNWRASAQPGWNWDREIAVVTGGSGDIGKAIALGLAQRGIRVAILDVREPSKELKNMPNITFFKCDVASAESVAEVAEAVRQRLGHPTILVNNAGVTGSHTIIDASDAWLRTIFGVNALALWNTAREFLPDMVSRNKGHVVTVASLASYVALPTAVDYSATKAAALAFHEGLGAEIRNVYRAPGVVTTVVHPSFVRTAMTEPHAARIERSGLVSMMRVEEVAGPVVRQVLARRGGHLIIPERLGPLAGFRGLPSWVQEKVRDMLGRV